MTKKTEHFSNRPGSLTSYINAGDIVEIAWDATKTKRAKFVRWRKTGAAIVRVERVDAKLKPLGTWGADRDVPGTSILRVLERALLILVAVAAFACGDNLPAPSAPDARELDARPDVAIDALELDAPPDACVPSSQDCCESIAGGDFSCPAPSCYPPAGSTFCWQLSCAPGHTFCPIGGGP